MSSPSVSSLGTSACVALSPAFLKEITDQFPADFLLTSEGDRETYGRDWTKVYAPNPCAIALPRTTDEVSRLLALCTQFDVEVVPSGGRTGLAGGAMATRGELVLSLERMRAMHKVDVVGATVRVQAGAITEAVHQHVEPQGFTWPVDFASKGSSQVGGNIATNAGGVKVIRYGLTRQWVLGLQVVLASGAVMELGGALEKNNTGIDLRQLFIGSEGILGVITEATLKLTRLPGKLDVMLFAVTDLAAVLALFKSARSGPFAMMAYEFFSDACLARLLRHRSARAPFGESYPYYVLLEVEQSHDLEVWLTSLFEDALIKDGVLAQHGGEARDLWNLREGISESLSATGLPHKNDISLPIAELESFTGKLHALFEAQYPDWEICLFGHVGDGNLHVNVMKPEGMAKAEFLQHASVADEAMFTLVKEHHGSISAEHGIGLLKKKYLHYTRTKAELTLMRQFKQVLDPKGILNPGKVLA